MPDFTVVQRGTDTSGRRIYATVYMWQWFDAVCRELGFEPTVTQGAFMSRVPGGGASASAGYHDAAGTFDLRVWDLTTSQVEQTIRTLRASGAAAWLRNPQHGGFSDPHIHFVLGTDEPLSQGAAYQWLAYINGGDGMGGRDYHPRPTPLVLEPPDSLMEEPMTPDDFEKIRAIVRDEVAKAGDTVKIDVGTKAKRSLGTVLATIHNRKG